MLSINDAIPSLMVARSDGSSNMNSHSFRLRQLKL